MNTYQMSLPGVEAPVVLVGGYQMELMPLPNSPPVSTSGRVAALWNKTAGRLDTLIHIMAGLHDMGDEDSYAAYITLCNEFCELYELLASWFPDRLIVHREAVAAEVGRAEEVVGELGDRPIHGTVVAKARLERLKDQLCIVDDALGIPRGPRHPANESI